MEEIYIPKSKLKKLVTTLSGKDREEAEDFLERLGIAKDITGTGVLGFMFEGKFYEAESHIDVLRKILEMIVQRFPFELEKLFLLRGRKRRLFSRDLNDVSPQSEKIKGTNIYFEKCDNSNTLKSRCKKVLELYGFDTSTFKIITN